MMVWVRVWARVVALGLRDGAFVGLEEGEDGGVLCLDGLQQSLFGPLGEGFAHLILAPSPSRHEVASTADELSAMEGDLSVIECAHLWLSSVVGHLQQVGIGFEGGEHGVVVFPRTEVDECARNFYKSVVHGLFLKNGMVRFSGRSLCVLAMFFLEKMLCLCMHVGFERQLIYIYEERTMCWRLMIVASCHHDMTADESYWSMQNYDSLVD